MTKAKRAAANETGKSVFEIVREAALSGEELDDAEIYRRAGLNPDDFYHGEEAAERFEIGLRATLGLAPRDEREKAILADIAETMDRGIRKSGYAPPAKVGGKWGDNDA